MAPPDEMYLRCDGCGQTASPEHIARRLRRLEWATRYRPVHIQTLLLGDMAPREDVEFLYAPATEGSGAPIGEFRGEAEYLLRAVGIEGGRPPLEAQGKQRAVSTTASHASKTVEEVHAEFQAAGLFLTHILECPLESAENGGGNASALLRKHLPVVASRIRRSLKPKRVMLVTEMPSEVVQDVVALDLGCEVILNDGGPFALTARSKEAEIARFRAVLDSRTMR
ncbi:MAG TPA: hypothetical protein VJN89_18765 [Candidatus Acidoferrum sp.]|nr:hypothetical protein [Candidatus Acidoferrum sp.]